MIEVIEESFEETYGEFVKRLFKIPVGIQAGLMHAAIGIAGEAGEFSDADSRYNLIEECGDLEFYVEACWQQVPEEFRESRLTRAKRDEAYVEFGFLASSLQSHSAALLDAAKKGWAYLKTPDWPEVISLLTATELVLDDAYEFLGVTTEQVRLANIGKLTRRYPTGTYSDEQASMRADKEPA